jgi:hypothetical protein
VTRMMYGPAEWTNMGDSGYHDQDAHPYDEDCDIRPRCRPADPNYVEETVTNPEIFTSARASVLREAADLITGDRNNQYGPPTQDFARTAELLNALGYRRANAQGENVPILPSDVAIIIAQVKVSRLMHSRGKRDSWVDLAGYAACGYECAVEEAEPGAS